MSARDVLRGSEASRLRAVPLGLATSLQPACNRPLHAHRLRGIPDPPGTSHQFPVLKARSSLVPDIM